MMREDQSLNPVAKTILKTNADRHRGRWSPWCRFQHQRQADTKERKDDSQHGRSSEGKSSRCSRQRSWVQMEKQQGHLVTANMDERNEGS